MPPRPIIVRGDVGRKCASGVTPRWLRHPCPRHHHEQGGQDEGTGDDQSYEHDCLNTFRSLNPSRQSITTTGDQYLVPQNKNGPVILGLRSPRS